MVGLCNFPWFFWFFKSIANKYISIIKYIKWVASYQTLQLHRTSLSQGRKEQKKKPLLPPLYQVHCHELWPSRIFLSATKRADTMLFTLCLAVCLYSEFSDVSWNVFLLLLLNGLFPYFMIMLSLFNQVALGNMLFMSWLTRSWLQMTGYSPHSWLLRTGDNTIMHVTAFTAVLSFMWTITGRQWE